MVPVCMQALAIGLLLVLPGLARANGTTPTTPTAPPRELVRHIGTVTGATDSFVIPMDPPIMSSRLTATGQATVLGQQFPVTLVSHNLITMGVDGVPLSSTGGLGVVSYPDGSAVFIHTNALIKPSTKEGFLTYEGTWTATGGKGMFLGASGSGTWNGEIEVATGKTTASWDGFDYLLSSVVKATAPAGQ
jgi:hypothetical protein